MVVRRSRRSAGAEAPAPKKRKGGAEEEVPPSPRRSQAKQAKGKKSQAKDGKVPLDVGPDDLRILVATDNHLGYKEEDLVRKDDSFNAFEEVFQIAVEQECDLVLLGGDIFHQNKPSKRTICKCIEILRKYCLDQTKKVTFKVLNSKEEGVFSTKFGSTNYEDPNFHVGLPTFTIHGNHDDPAGVDQVSPLDILSSSNLINYYGKHAIEGDGTGSVTIKPVLLGKGNTKVALYGLGWLKDERLSKLFTIPNGVKWNLPKESRGEEDEFFNIFTVHQNRVHHRYAQRPTPSSHHHVRPIPIDPNRSDPIASLTHSLVRSFFSPSPPLPSLIPLPCPTLSPKMCVKESSFWNGLDLVIWGHEHDSLCEPVQAEGDMNYVISQPGSTVQTALTKGEAKQKHCMLLEIQEKRWRAKPIPLKSVRPFIFDELQLSKAMPNVAAFADDQEEDQDFQANVDERSKEIERVVEARVEEVLGLMKNAAPDSSPKRKLPLVRLRVDYSGFTTINTQRFGQKFVGRVANPNDIIHFVSKKPGGGGDGEGTSNAKLHQSSNGGNFIPDAQEQDCIDQYIADNLTTNLEVLKVKDLNSAVHDFVEKDESKAFHECIQKAVVRRAGMENGAKGHDDLVADILKETNGAVILSDDEENGNRHGDDDDDDEFVPPTKAKTKAKAKAKKPARARPASLSQRKVPSSAKKAKTGAGTSASAPPSDSQDSLDFITPLDPSKKITKGGNFFQRSRARQSQASQGKQRTLPRSWGKPK